MRIRDWSSDVCSSDLTPFYVSSEGYGVFINSARYLDVYAGTAVRKDSKHPPVARDRNTDPAWSAQPYSDAVEVLVPAGGVEIYVFGGPTPLDAVTLGRPSCRDLVCHSM